MKKIRILLLILVSTTLTACLTPMYATLPESKLEFRIIDSISKRPIAGAKLNVIYQDNLGEKIVKKPVLTDKKGMAFLTLEKERFWIWRPEGFFNGGVSRYISINAKGYISVTRNIGDTTNNIGKNWEYELERSD